ncbi:MAG TPA: NAD-dependent epimerase/dehydratase family protein [Candidatus Angelobacter sp.]|nr:NAD-dependent epimerase/dehydratase family protein [Candidatus Angelobacter sp.]
MKKVLISGGLGFIGLHLAKVFKDNGFPVVLMDNLSEQIHGVLPSLNNPILQERGVDCVRGDVRRRNDWRAALEGVAIVVHLAAETGTAQSMYEIGRYTEINVDGTAVLLDILANEKHSVEKILLASSRSVYGEGSYDCSKCGRVYPHERGGKTLRVGQWEPACPWCGDSVLAVPTSEEAKLNPASIYAVTKLAQENLVRVAGIALGIATVILRFQNVYGEWQSLKNPYTGILSIFSNKLNQKKPISLYEDGRQTRDFVHVTDVVRAVYLAATLSGGDGKTLNVGSGVPSSVADIAWQLKRCFGISSSTEVSGEYRLGDIRHCYADLTAIRTGLGFEPQVDLASGIERFVDWVRTQPHEPDRLQQATSALVSRGLMG